MTNDRFSWKRFGRFARAEMAGQERKTCLKVVGFTLFCSTVYGLWNIQHLLDHSLGDSGIFLARFFVFICFAFIVSLNLSRSFKRYFSKGEAVASFMIPAAQSEKFLYAALKNMLVVPLGLLAILWLNDLFWCLLLGQAKLQLGYIFENIVTHLDTVLVQLMTGSLVHGFALLSFLLAGAVVFRRHQYLKSLLALFVLSTPWFILFQVVPCLIPILNSILKSAGQILITNILTFGFGVFWLVVAWRRFSTLQITK